MTDNCETGQNVIGEIEAKTICLQTTYQVTSLIAHYHLSKASLESAFLKVSVASTQAYTRKLRFENVPTVRALLSRSQNSRKAIRHILHCDNALLNETSFDYTWPKR